MNKEGFYSIFYQGQAGSGGGGTRVFDTGTPVLEPSQPYGSVDLVGWR
jgi:hypothetical protein